MMRYEGYPLSMPLTEELHGVVMKKISKKKKKNASTVMKQRSQLPISGTAVFSLCQQSSWSRGSPMPPLGCFDSLIHSN